jgi:hypothetical protein
VQPVKENVVQRNRTNHGIMQFETIEMSQAKPAPMRAAEADYTPSGRDGYRRSGTP